MNEHGHSAACPKLATLSCTHLLCRTSAITQKPNNPFVLSEYIPPIGYFLVPERFPLMDFNAPDFGLRGSFT